MRPRLDQAPAAIRTWRVAGIVHANIPRTVFHSPSVITPRPAAEPRPPALRERHDLALNILNLFMPPQMGAGAELAPVKCFRGHCSAFAARYHRAFAEQFLAEISADEREIGSGAIASWIEQRLAGSSADEDDGSEDRDLRSA